MKGVKIGVHQEWDLRFGSIKIVSKIENHGKGAGLGYMYKKWDLILGTSGGGI